MMKRKLFILLAFLCVLSAPAMAQDSEKQAVCMDQVVSTNPKDAAMAERLRSAIDSAGTVAPRIAVVLPGTQWELAGEDRSAQHYAITLLDALCVALLS